MGCFDRTPLFRRRSRIVFFIPWMMVRLSDRDCVSTTETSARRSLRCILYRSTHYFPDQWRHSVSRSPVSRGAVTGTPVPWRPGKSEISIIERRCLPRSHPLPVSRALFPPIVVTGGVGRRRQKLKASDCRSDRFGRGSLFRVGSSRVCSTVAFQEICPTTRTLILADSNIRIC
jgi:hypothetical protein